MRKLVFIVALLSFQACTLFESSDLQESYIHFNEPNVQTLLEQGAPSHNIKDFWIEMDGVNLGVWAVDRTIPFLPQNDPATVFIFPGIKNNGFQNNGVIYPFYEVIELSKNFEPGEVDTMTLEYTYSDFTKFSFIEDFSGAHLFTRDEDEDEESFIFTETLDGNQIGVLNPFEESPIVNASTSLVFTDIPLDGRAVYLELDYKSDIEFTVGIIGLLGATQEATIPKIILKPQENWNKIYIDFTAEISGSQLEDGYRMFFAAQNEGTDKENQKVYIDNVKLVHF